MSVPIDCTDAERLGAFWADVLGWEVTGRGWQRTAHGPDGVTIAPAEGGTFELDFRWVPDGPPSGKNRLHLDLNPDDRDQESELARLHALGATPVDVGQRADSTWHVLADPEGNVFCLCRRQVSRR
jgi:predicted enzyme related to lactoylglutathione lyase